MTCKLLSSELVSIDLTVHLHKTPIKGKSSKKSDQSSHGFAIGLSESPFETSQMGPGQQIKLFGSLFYFWSDDSKKNEVGYIDYGREGAEVMVSKVGKQKFTKNTKFILQDNTKATIRVTLDKKERKIFITRVNKEKNTKDPVMSITLNSEKSYNNGVYLTLVAFSGEKMGIRVYIDEVSVSERIVEAVKEIEKDYTKINDALVNEFLHMFNTPYTRGINPHNRESHIPPLLNVLIHNHHLNSTSNALTRKVKSMSDQLNSVVYQNSNLMQNSFGATNQYKDDYKKMLTKLNELVEMQNEIYTKIKEGEKNLGEVGLIETFLEDVDKLELFVENLNSLLGLQEVQQIISRLFALESKLGKEYMDEIELKIHSTLDTKLDEYEKSVSSNIVFYVVILILVVSVGGFFVMKSLRKAEKQHYL